MNPAAEKPTRGMLPDETAQTRLRRALGPLMATAVVVGTVIGSGVFKKPQPVAENVPNFGCVALVWILGGMLALFGSLALAEVAVLYPRAGGNYVFLREGFGRLFGFLWGWVEFWIIRTASIAALATIVTESLHVILREYHQAGSGEDVLGYWEERFLTVGLIAALALVNMRGVQWGGMLQLAVTTVKVCSLAAIMLLPFAFREPFQRPEVTPSTTPAADFSWKGLGIAMLAVQWAYHGWMNIATVAEEVKEPQRNIPLALFGGIGIVIVLYLGANVAYHSVIPLGEMRGIKNRPVATEFCLRLLGPTGALFASAAVMCSAFGALNGNILVGPRVLYAMGQDQLAPRLLGVVSERYRTPALAILVVSLWSCGLVLGCAAVARWGLPVISVTPDWEINLNLPPDKSHFDVLTDFAMFGAVVFETMAVSTIFVFRKRLPDVSRPYRCPGYPLTPIIYIAILTAIAANTLLTQQTESAVALVFFALGAAVYGLALRRPAAT